MPAGVFLTFVDTSFIAPFIIQYSMYTAAFKAWYLLAVMKGLMRACLYKVMQAFLLYD